MQATAFAGDGVEQDYADALRWFLEGAEAGDIHAQFQLATMYYEGKGVEQDFSKALHWTREAASAGLIAAKELLGYMYFRGEGVAKDLVKAYAWMTYAAKHGNSSADYATELVSEMTDDDIARGRDW